MRGRHTSEATTERKDRHDYWGVVLEAPDATALARFYAELLGWAVVKASVADATIEAPDGVAYLAFQTAADYERPVWPAASGAQRITMHLDFEVSDLADAVEHALELGAQLAGHQPQEDVRVLLDPAGYPFCLYLG